MTIKRTKNGAATTGKGNRSKPKTQRRSVYGFINHTRSRAQTQAEVDPQKGNYMDREHARQEIRSSWRQLIPEIAQPAQTRVNGETSYICPLCGHGTHGDGLTVNPRSADGNGLKCFGCDFSGDIIDLYQRTTGLDYNAAFSLMAQALNITVDPYTTANRTAAAQRDFSAAGDINTPPAAKAPQNANNGLIDAPADYTQYYRECRERLQDPAAVSYLAARGISTDTAAAHWIGFDPAADPAQSGHKAPRIIIPTCAGHYIGRSIDPDTPKQYAKMNNKGGTPAIFNLRAIYAQGVQEVFVTEGAFDALSIIEAGAAAIALNSTSNADKLIAALQERRTAATLILCLDNDEAGRKAADTLKQGLQRLNISHITADICGGHKDPNEALTADRGAFVEAIAHAQHMTAAKPDNTAYYIDQIMTGEIERFKAVKNTGFANLDKQAGGLYSGLYAVAAISSLGKTTFCHQIADQLAAAGSDVLFFSLEQSRLELVSKSIARRTAINDMENAVTSLSIRRGYLPAQVLKAAEQYKQEVQDRVSIIEGNFACNISFIGDYTREYIRKTGTRPVVFIDYLQILQPEQNGNRQQTTKEMVDSSITELKRISRELDLTVFVVCSVNRANYLTPVDFESLKESGGIEYTCDVIWGLQLQCLNDPIFDKQNNIKERREKIKEAKAATPRKIELVCLKNRYGIANYSCYFDYYPANDLFQPCSDAELDFDPVPKQHKAGRYL